MTTQPQPIRRAAVAAAVASALALAGCSAVSAPETTPEDSPPSAVFEHIHELVIDPTDGTLLVATHEGLFRLAIGPDGSATSDGPIGGLDFDPMGFTIVDGTAYASGHPGPTTPDTFGRPNLGLITSSDGGETWTNVSLTGTTDFHALTVLVDGVSATEVFGYDASASRVELSTDGGATWSNGAELEARDLLAQDGQLYATTRDGLAISTDSGATFSVDLEAPSLVVLAADQDGTIAGVDNTGTIWIRPPGEAWDHHHTISGTPQAFAIDGGRIYVADDRGIAMTDDAGATWTVVSVGG